MAVTNFTLLLDEQKKVWSRQTWGYARNYSFMNKFAGGQDSMVHRVTELTKTERGDQAVITLVADLEKDGVAGDNWLEGNEEDMKAYDQVITIDQFRHGNRTKGRITDQKTIVNFREHSRDKLAYWLADRMDQMAFLTLSGVAYTERNNGATRTGSNLPSLAFASDVTAPTAGRYLNWDASASDFVAGSTATVEATDLVSYEMLVRLKALAYDKYVRPIRAKGGIEFFHIFMSPQSLAQLKLDPDYLASVQQAMPRSELNQFFKGTPLVNSTLVDGMMIHTHRHVYNTQGLTSGVDKWGSGNDVEGNAVLLCGAQALAMADLGAGYWEEEKFDYKNQLGISYGKMFGLLKPVFRTQYETPPSDEDFGVIRVNTAM